MNEKKTVLAVILGVSFVSLVAALIAGFIDGLMILTDFHEYYGIMEQRYDVAVAALELVVIMLGIALVLMFLLLKNNRKKALIYTCISLVALAILSLIILRAMIPDNFRSTIYGLYTSYVTTSITVTVSSVLLVVSYIYLLKQQKAKPTNPAQEVSENVETSAQPKDNQSENQY